jgi:hypothetical protein
MLTVEANIEKKGEMLCREITKVYIDSKKNATFIYCLSA